MPVRVEITETTRLFWKRWIKDPEMTGLTLSPDLENDPFHIPAPDMAWVWEFIDGATANGLVQGASCYGQSDRWRSHLSIIKIGFRRTDARQPSTAANAWPQMTKPPDWTAYVLDDVGSHHGCGDRICAAFAVLGVFALNDGNHSPQYRKPVIQVEWPLWVEAA